MYRYCSRLDIAFEIERMIRLSPRGLELDGRFALARMLLRDLTDCVSDPRSPTDSSMDRSYAMGLVADQTDITLVADCSRAVLINLAQLDQFVGVRYNQISLRRINQGVYGGS